MTQPSALPAWLLDPVVIVCFMAIGFLFGFNVGILFVKFCNTTLHQWLLRKLG